MYPPNGTTQKKKTPGQPTNQDAFTNAVDLDPGMVQGKPTSTGGSNQDAFTNGGLVGPSGNPDAFTNTGTGTSVEKPNAPVLYAGGQTPAATTNTPSAPVLYAGGSQGNMPTPTASAPSKPVGAADWATLGVTPDQASQNMPIPGQPGKVLFHNGSSWEVRDAGGGGATTPSTPTVGAPAAGGAPGTPVGAADWGRLGIRPDQATQNMPVPGMPGKVLFHNGSSWEVRDAAGGATDTPPLVGPTPTAPATPATPTPTGPAATPTAPAVDTPTTAPGAGGMVPIGAPGTAPTQPQDPQTTAYKQALLRMLDQASTPASLENDPALKAQSDAAALGLTRGTEAGRAALAERMAQQGGAGVDSGAFNSELAGLFSGQGEQQAGINAGLVGEANRSKVQQLQSALTMMGSDINSEQGRALTRELAQAQLAEGAREFEMNYGLEGKRLAETIRQFDTTTQAGKDALAQQLAMFKQQMAEQGREFDVDAAMKKLGITSQSSLGERDIALRDKLGSGGLNAQILQMLMQGDQFGKSLGADLGKFNATNNRSYLDALLSQLGG